MEQKPGKPGVPTPVWIGLAVIATLILVLFVGADLRLISVVLFAVLNGIGYFLMARGMKIAAWAVFILITLILIATFVLPVALPFLPPNFNLR